jgi:hypothetical protein
MEGSGHRRSGRRFTLRRSGVFDCAGSETKATAATSTTTASSSAATSTASTAAETEAGASATTTGTEG